MDLEVPVIGILRGISADFFGPLMESSFKAGLQAIEVTFNTPGAEKIVSAHVGAVPPGRYLGMGTIRNVNEARKAVDAGAMYLVSPNMDPKVIQFAKKSNVPIIAGAFTPTEVYHAWCEGADMVKVFPCGGMGPGYIKDLLGPFDDVPLVAVGGVTKENARQFIESGAKAVGVGASLFGKGALASQQLSDIGVNVKQFIHSSTS